MSMNIFFEATRDIQVIKTGKIEVQTATRSVWQTPTEITYEILKSADPIAAYKAWVLTQGETVKVPVYAEDDVWEWDDPIGFRESNAAEEHVCELDQWIKDMTEAGWSIKVEMI